jgi:hypothetical protein
VARLHNSVSFLHLSYIYKAMEIFITYPNIGAGVAQSVWQLATGWTTEGSEFESGKFQEFSPLHVVQTGTEAHPTSYQMGTGGSFPGSKAAGA